MQAAPGLVLCDAAREHSAHVEGYVGRGIGQGRIERKGLEHGADGLFLVLVFKIGHGHVVVNFAGIGRDLERALIFLDCLENLALAPQADAKLVECAQVVDAQVVSLEVKAFAEIFFGLDRIGFLQAHGDFFRNRRDLLHGILVGAGHCAVKKLLCRVSIAPGHLQFGHFHLALAI